MGWNEKCVRWEYSIFPICFNKNIWSLFGKEYFSKSIERWFKAVISLIIICEPSFYYMLKAIGMKKNFMAFAYFTFRGAIFYMAPLLYWKWITMEQKLNRLFWLASQKPYLTNLVYAKWWDKKIKEAINLFK